MEMPLMDVTGFRSMSTLSIFYDEKVEQEEGAQKQGWIDWTFSMSRQYVFVTAKETREIISGCNTTEFIGELRLEKWYETVGKVVLLASVVFPVIMYIFKCCSTYEGGLKIRLKSLPFSVTIDGESCQTEAVIYPRSALDENVVATEVIGLFRKGDAIRRLCSFQSKVGYWGEHKSGDLVRGYHQMANGVMLMGQFVEPEIDCGYTEFRFGERRLQDGTVERGRFEYRYNDNYKKVFVFTSGIVLDRSGKPIKKVFDGSTLCTINDKQYVSVEFGDVTITYDQNDLPVVKNEKKVSVLVQDEMSKWSPLEDVSAITTEGVTHSEELQGDDKTLVVAL